MGGVLLITVVFGILIALLIDQPVKGQGALRILVIAPFFVMPPVAASIWENLFMHPQNGLFAALARGFGAQPILFLEDHPMLSVIGIVSWEWLPFATLILLTRCSRCPPNSWKPPRWMAPAPSTASATSCCRT